MPMESHERDHEEARETRRWVIEMRAQVTFAKWAAASAAVAGSFIKWVA